MNLVELRSRWSEVLNALEAKNRTAWLVFFDARLANLDGKILTLDFSDSEKFGYGIEYNERRAKFKVDLQKAIHEVCEIDVDIVDR